MTNICPHCGWELAPGNYSQHISVCPHNSKVREAVLKFCKRISDTPGQIPTCEEYTKACKGVKGIPGNSKLMRTFGNWGNVAKWLGLKTHEDSIIYDMNRIFERMRELSTELYDGEIGPSYNDWREWAGDEYPSTWWIQKRLGNWSEIVKMAGLRSASREEYKQWKHKKRQEMEQKLSSEDIPKLADNAIPVEWPLETIKRKRMIRTWNPRTHCYETVGYQTVYELK